MNFLKKQKEKIPDINSFVSKNFDVEKYWKILVVSFFVLTIILGCIGGAYAYSIYTGNYITENYSPDFSGLIKEVRLKSIIEKRQNFVNQDFVGLKNPSQ